MQIALPLHENTVTYEQEMIVHAYVADILSKDVTTYVTRVISFTAIRRGFVARVEVPDGVLMDITIHGPLGAGA